MKPARSAVYHLEPGPWLGSVFAGWYSCYVGHSYACTTALRSCHEYAFHSCIYRPNWKPHVNSKPRPPARNPASEQLPADGLVGQPDCIVCSKIPHEAACLPEDTTCRICIAARCISIFIRTGTNSAQLTCQIHRIARVMCTIYDDRAPRHWRA